MHVCRFPATGFSRSGAKPTLGTGATRVGLDGTAERPRSAHHRSRQGCRAIERHWLSSATRCDSSRANSSAEISTLNRVHFGIVGSPSWLGILLFPYEDLGWNKAFSDQCYELTISAGGRRLRICAIWP